MATRQQDNTAQECVNRIVITTPSVQQKLEQKSTVTNKQQNQPTLITGGTILNSESLVFVIEGISLG